jgi:hypothetical protein
MSSSAPPQPAPVQNALNLMLTIKPGQTETILAYLAENSSTINAALTQVGTVHFARFLYIPNTQYLFVITAYDGDFETYLMAFTKILGDVFNKLLSCVDPAPPLPVQDNPQAFSDFVQKNNLTSGLYSAYPQCTVTQIWFNGCAKPQ